MQKSLKIVAFLFLLNASVCMAVMQKQAIMKQFMEHAEACQAEVGAAASDIEDIIKKQPAAGMEGKCLRACILKSFKLMGANGKFDKAASLEQTKQILADEPEKMKIASAMADVCADIPVSDNACEAAEQYGKCFHEEAIKHGVENEEY